MRTRIIRTIAQKELLEAFRDRRTLFLMVFLPILLYPALLLIITQVAMVQATKLEEQASVIAYARDDESHPLILALSEDDRINLVATDAQPEEIASDLGFDAYVDLREWPADLPMDGTARVEVSYESVEEASVKAAERVEERIEAWRIAEVEARLASFELSPSIVNPVEHELVDRSAPSEKGGYTLGAILPILVIATVLLGAYYPAIDLTAGEKERGSIQTLFTAPITPFEIVAGKYLAVLGISMVSGMANLLSMALLFSQNLFLSGDVLSELDFTLSLPVLGAIFLNILLMALFFSSLLLTVAVLAKSYKEGQNYITPVYLALFLPATVAQMPGFELTPQLAVVPAVNLTLLMKELLVDGVSLESLFLVSISTLVFTAMVLVLASKLFSQEQVILGERGSLALVTRRNLTDPDRRPTLGEGMALYGVAFVLLFYIGTVIQSRDISWGLLGTLYLLVLMPAVLLSLYLRLDLRDTFNLKRPRPRALLASLLLGLSAWLVVAWLNSFITEYVFAPPAEMEQALDELFPSVSGVAGWTWLLFLVSISPAICEEAMFRGFLFSSLRKRVAPWALIVITAIMFGAFHLSAYRLFGTTMLGLVMGLLVYKSGSIWTSAIFHGVSNASVLVGFALLPEFIGESGQIPIWLVALGIVGCSAGLALLLPLRSPWAETSAATQ